MEQSRFDKDTDEPSKFRKEGHIDKLQRQMYSRYKQPAIHPRRELSALQRRTKSNWDQKTQTTSEEETQPRKRAKRGYSWQSILLVITLSIFIVAGGMVTYLFFSGSNIITARKIGMEVNGPRTINAGDILPLQIAIRNNNNADLESVDLTITYPEGARIPGKMLSTIKTQDIPLGTISPGSVRNGIARAVLFGRAGETQDIKVTAEYRLKGSSAIFSTSRVYTVFIVSSALNIVVNTNSQTIAGQTMIMDVTITSRAKNTMRNIVLKAKYPFGFLLKSSTPKVDTDGTWNLGDITAGEKKTIRIVGTLDGQAGDTRIFRFSAGTQNNIGAKALDVTLADFVQKVTVERPFLGMTLAFNGKAAQEYVGKPGQKIPIKLYWKNNLNVALTDVVIAASIKGDAFSPFRISVFKGFFRSFDSLVIWDKTTDPTLGSVAPGESGIVSLMISPRETRELASVTNPTISFELHAAAQRLSETNVPESMQATVNKSIKISTDVGISGKSLYKENPLGSVGPLPPKVDNETTYGIMWNISNSTNNIKNAVLSAELPVYVRWLGVVSPAAENVTFNPASRIVSWRVGTLLGKTGNGVSLPRRVVFSVGFTPSVTQIGQTPTLLQKQRFTGLDTFTNSVINRTMRDLTTNLNEINFPKEYGTVVR